MTKIVRLGVAQARTLDDLPSTLQSLEATTKRAADQHGVQLLLFPEAYLGGYPRGASFGALVGGRSDEGRDQFLAYWRQAVDLGDTPAGAGDAWTDRKLPSRKTKVDGDEHDKDGQVTQSRSLSLRVGRGDGTREELERIARETGVFLVVGLVERAGGSLYCGVVYVSPSEGIIGKRRKVMPTGSERLIWAQGSPSTLRAVTTIISGVRICLAAAICWENYMPLLRHSLYSQNVNLYLAPTADARDGWLSLMRTVALEGRCFVLSANQCVKPKQLPSWIQGQPSRVGETVRPRLDRAQSLVTKTADNHEITWPTHESQKPETEAQRHARVNGPGPGLDRSSSGSVLSSEDGAVQGSGARARRRSSIITRTEDNHEITWPFPGSSKTYPAPEAATGGTAAVSDHHVEEGGRFSSRGGSCIVAPNGEVLAGPLWDADGDVLHVAIDFEDCERCRLDIDVAGSYSRNDAFKLSVAGLDLNPPP